MKYVVSALFLILCVIPASAQYLDPMTKSTLDYYYDGKTNQIDGSRIIDGSVTTNKFNSTILDLWMYVDGRNPMEANLPMGTHRLTGLSEGVDPSDSVTKSYVDSLTSNTNILNQYLTTESQAFTAIAGFEVVTNLTSVSRGNFTTTHSNMINNVAGWYRIDPSASFESSAVNVASDGHLFIDNVEFERIGWSMKLATAVDQGSAAGGGLIYLDAGSIVDFRVDVDKDTTLSFDHISILYDQR